MRSALVPFRTVLFLAAWLGLAVEDGQTAGELVFGQSAALSGPARELGQGMRLGLLAAFEGIKPAGRVARSAPCARIPGRCL